jgi:CxxC-x17-CxxC domain-containing protein
MSVTVFAKTNFRGNQNVFGIKEEDRRRHMYMVGKTGMGKTNLIETMVIQDINAGKGVAFVDPHGDTAEKLLHYIPSSRYNDVVYFNPADLDFPVAFNVLETVDESHKHLVAAGMMGVFKKIWPDVWSPRMEHILNYSILALLDYPGSTMLGINRILSDKKYRNKVLNRVTDPIVKSFWINEFGKWNERYLGEAIAPIQNKVGQFIATPIIRNIVSQTKSTIDMREIMDQGKILIVNLSKGRIGEEIMQLLGGMVITKLQLAAMERVDQPESERRDFYLYIDEFQNFATESFTHILSEARKYRLNLIITHQYISQLMIDNSSQLKDAVFGNVGTLISFRVGAEDAEFIEKEFEPVVMANDLVNLPKFHIYLKLMIDGVAGDAFSAITLPPLSPPLDGRSANKVIKVSRQRYSKDRSKIEEKIARWALNDEQKREIKKEQAKKSENLKDKKATKQEKAGKLNKDTDQTENAKKITSKDNWHESVCDKCQKETKVPFKPDGLRKIYCKECLVEVKKNKKINLNKNNKSQTIQSKANDQTSQAIQDLIRQARER